MKKTLAIMIMTALILIGCQSAPTIAPEEVINETYENRDEVNNYFIQSDMKIKIDALGKKETQTAIFKGDIDEENTEANIETIERAGNTEKKANIIYKDGTQYMHADNTWHKNETTIDNFREAGTTYYNIVESLHNFNEHATVKKEKDQYIATYEGTAEEVFYIFQEPFSLTLNGFDLEDETTITVRAEIDAKTYNLTQLDIHIDAETEAGSVQMTVDTTFTNFGEIEIEVPQEALDQAQ